jgi:hypothetical protein
VPFHTHFGCLDFQLIRNEEELNIEGKAIDVHDLEEKLSCLPVEKLEAALSIFCLDAQ